MTVANRDKDSSEQPWRAAASAPAQPTRVPSTPAYVLPPPRPARPLDALSKAVKTVAGKMPAIRRLERGPTFEDARVAALAELSEARETLGAYLDKHPRDDRGNRLWDRLQGLYIALKKL